MDAHGKSSSKRFYLTLTLLFGILLLTSALKADQIHDGDVAPRGNPDGQVDVADALVLQRLATGLITPTADEQTHGDIAPICNPDGVIDISDALIGLRVATGQLTIDATPPAITITSHNSGDILFDPNVTISGTIDDNSASVSVYVNGVPATVGSGTYSADITLGAGPNTIIVDAIDPCQNQSQLQITLNYSTGPTYVSGNISADTLWTTAGTPYIITGNITVDNGATLTVDQGTEIRFGGLYEFRVNGTLLVQGALGNQVTFTSDNQSPANGDWKGIFIAAPGSVIEYAVINYARRGVTVSAADAIIRNCTIMNFSYAGIEMGNGAGGTISGNIIQNGWDYGIYLLDGSPAISGNTIQNCGNYGIYVYDGSPAISGNRIQNNSMYGIAIYNRSNPLIDNGNIITGNAYGLYVQGAGLAGFNPNPVVTGNEIYSNSTYNYNANGFYDPSHVVLDATNNWWGTTNLTVIAETIMDYSDYSTGPLVNFIPFLDGPGGNPVNVSYLNGPINSDMTLPAGTFYNVVGKVSVAQDKTLTIEPGVTLHIAGNYGLIVEGTLIVQGNTGSEVVFTSDQSVSGWQGITVKNISIGTTIDHALIQNADTGISVYGADVTLRDSTIDSYALRGLYLENCLQGTISNNRILNEQLPVGYKTGTGIYLLNSSPLITGNVIAYIDTGIHIANQSNPTITGGNTIRDNQYGISVYGNGQESYDPHPVVTGNEIYNSTGRAYNTMSFYDPVSTMLYATGNWWGTADAKTIHSKIYDWSDEPKTDKPIVSFVPFLDAPQGSPVTNSAEGYKYVQGGTLIDRTFTLAESPYVVIGQYLIPDNITLAVEPGVTLFFLDNLSGLYTLGNLLIDGGTEPVTLTSYSLSPSFNDWEGITFNNPLNNGAINHAIIEYADRGISCYNGASPTIQNSKIRDCMYGIYTQKQAGMGDPNPTVNLCELYDNISFNFYNVSAVFNPGTSTIDATNNWWGSNNASTIQSYIWDYDDNNSLASVGFDPYIIKFSPNGDGADETITICYDFGTVVTWTLTIKDDADQAVWTDQGTGSTICRDWDGSTDSGVPPVAATGNYTYFLDVSGTTYSSGIITLDKSPPASASVAILDQQYVNYRDITLSLISQDAEEMIISEQSDFSGAVWQAFARASTHTLSSVEEPKTIYVKFRDQSNNQTAAVTDSVVYDVTPPVVNVSYPPNGEIF